MLISHANRTLSKTPHFNSAGMASRVMSEVVAIAKALRYNLDAAPQSQAVKQRTVGLSPSLLGDVLNDQRPEDLYIVHSESLDLSYQSVRV